MTLTLSQATLLHHVNVKITLLPSKLNVATPESMQSQDAPLVKVTLVT